MDYVDRSVPMLARMFEKRMRGYRAMGYSVGDLAARACTEDERVSEPDQRAFRDSDDDEFP